MQYTRKQHAVYAVQFNGSNVDEVKEAILPQFIGHDKAKNIIIVSTFKGDQIVNVSDWIIKDYSTSIQIVVMNDITFNANYETVKE